MRTAAREEEHRQIREMSNGFRKGLLDVIRQVEVGYSRVMLMYSIAFYAGIVLIGVSVFASLWLKENVAAMIFGGLGMADLVTALIFRPAQELQNSRGNLTQLQAAFFNWANDVRNWNAYLERIDASARPGQTPSYHEFEQVSKRVLANTAEMMHLVDLYCEMHPSRGTDSQCSKSGDSVWKKIRCFLPTLETCRDTRGWAREGIHRHFVFLPHWRGDDLRFTGLAVVPRYTIAQAIEHPT